MVRTAGIQPQPSTPAGQHGAGPGTRPEHKPKRHSSCVTSPPAGRSGNDGSRSSVHDVPRETNALPGGLNAVSHGRGISTLAPLPRRYADSVRAR